MIVKELVYCKGKLPRESKPSSNYSVSILNKNGASIAFGKIIITGDTKNLKVIMTI